MSDTDRTIRAVVFDLDDTLYPERSYVRSGYAAVARYLRETLGRDEPFERWLWRRFQSGKVDRAFDGLSDHFGLNLASDRIAELVEVYRNHEPAIRPYEGVVELLSVLRARYRLGVLSDGFLPAQRLKLDALGVERFFDAVLFTEQIGRDAWKPSPAGFEAIRSKLDLPHEACAYVADNPAKDFVAPNKLGWRTIQWLRPGQIHAANRPPEAGEPQHVVRLGGELCGALRA